MARIEWRRDPANRRLATALWALGLAPLYGMVLVATVGLVAFSGWLVVGAATGRTGLGESAALLVALVLLLLAKPWVFPWLWQYLPGEWSLGREDSLVHVVAVGVLGVVGIGVAPAVHPLGLPVFFFGAPLVCLPVRGTVFTAGWIDPDERRLRIVPAEGASRFGSVDVALDDWVGLRRLRLGNTVVLWPRYARGSGFGNPRPLAVPAWIHDEAAEADVFATALSTDPEGAGREPRPLQAAILGSFGIGLLAFAAWFVLIAPIPTALAAWIVSLLALSGVWLLAVAVRHR